MAAIFRNALIVHFDPPKVAAGDLRTELGYITDVGVNISASASDDIIDCNHSLLLPGLVNGHTHLYSSLALGMPPPPRQPQNFHEILQLIWWRLDRAHTLESVWGSSLIGGMDALRSGVTTLIDHHSSPTSIDGSLDEIEKGLAKVGCRGILCYETSDRNGIESANVALQENKRYALKCNETPDNRFAGMIGAHASFTLSNETLAECINLAESVGSGIHIHAAEDTVDDELSQSQYGSRIVERFRNLGLFDLWSSIIAHGIHFSPDEIGTIKLFSDRIYLAHNPRSNSNNSVGNCPIEKYNTPILLGTDGIDQNILAEAKFVWYNNRNRYPNIIPSTVLRMLADSARIASHYLNTTIGKIEVGAAADIVLTNYQPIAAMNDDNLAQHIIYGLCSRHVTDVMIAGQWCMRKQEFININETEIRESVRDIAASLHERYHAIPCD